MKWLQCSDCRHVYTASYWTDAGLQEVFKTAHSGQVWDGHTDASRHLWGAIIDRVQSYLAPAWTSPLTWVDVGCGNGGLVMTVCEFGFTGVGVDPRREPVEAIRKLGYVAIQSKFADLQVDQPVQVVSMMDMLEHTPWPVAALQQAHSLLADYGILVLSMPNMDCPAWRAMQAAQANPYWGEIEHHHNFTRQRLFQILESCGLEPLHYGVSVRYKACMEVIARRRASNQVPVV
jgi:2-polyprenyl-3-methyl-5-hydroxy-6-metoxy-1,4-benzoquinol methylase